MSVERSGRTEPVEPRAVPRDDPARVRFAELLASMRSARKPGALDAAGSRARTGHAPGATSPRPVSRKAAIAADGAPDLRPPDPSSTAPSLPDRHGDGTPDPAGAAELRACIRAVPPVIAATLRPGAAELALSFGSALSLDLRSGAQGLELTLRPASGLERVTRAELPGLVDALRARGLRVARAEVRPRAPAPRRAR
jgi:hypothetical protein